MSDGMSSSASSMPIVEWRWDQGRLRYFRFDSIKAVARALAPLDRVKLNTRSDPLRNPLRAIGLPFLPTHYRVWRNYARVFGAACLATNVDDKLRTTDLCRALAHGGDDQLTADDYFAFLVPRFSFPSPVFAGYSHTGPTVFPLCGLLRFMMTHIGGDGFGRITLDEVFAFVIGNGCIGSEPLDFYRGLSPTARGSVGDEARQIREFLIFFSQFSFLQWVHPETLYLDVDAFDRDAFTKLEALASPIVRRRNSHRSRELLELGAFAPGYQAPVVPEREIPEDVLFTEGSRVRSNHLRLERSPKLRAMLFGSLRGMLCNMCGRTMQRHYPWADPRSMLEVHHLLPLGSAVKIDERGTRLADLVALCPSCHGSVHIYYRHWLRGHGLSDFRSRQEAVTVYRECKAQYVN